MKPRLLFFLSFFLILPGLRADDEKPRVFRFVALGQNYDDVFFDSHNAPVPVVANSGSFSPAYPAPKTGKLALYRLTPPPPDAPAGTRPVRTVVAEIVYPSETGKAIVLLYPGRAGEPLPISGLAIADPEDGHTVGHARIFNLSSLTAAVGADQTVAEVPPRSTDRKVSFGVGPMQIKVAAQTGSGWQVVMAMERNLPANLRLFVLLVDAPPAYEGGPPVSSMLVYDFIRPPFKPRQG